MQVLPANPDPLFHHERVARDLKSYHTYCATTAISAAVLLIGGVGLALSRVNPASLNRSIVLGMTIFSATITGIGVIGLSISLKKLSRPSNSRPPPLNEKLLSEIYEDIMCEDPSYKYFYDTMDYGYRDHTAKEDKIHDFYSKIWRLFNKEYIEINDFPATFEENFELLKAKIRNKSSADQVQFIYGFTMAAFELEQNKGLIEAIIEFQRELGINENSQFINKLASNEFIEKCYWKEHLFTYLKQTLNEDEFSKFFSKIFPLLNNSQFPYRNEQKLNLIFSILVENKESAILNTYLQWLDQNQLLKKINLDLKNLSYLCESVEDDEIATINILISDLSKKDSSAMVYREISVPKIIARILFPTFEEDSIEIKLSGKFSANVLLRLFGFDPEDPIQVNNVPTSDWYEMFQLGTSLGNRELVNYALEQISKVNIDATFASELLCNFEKIPKEMASKIYTRILISLANRYSDIKFLPYSLKDIALLNVMRSLFPNYFKSLQLSDFTGESDVDLDKSFFAYQIMSIFSQSCVVFYIHKLSFKTSRKEFFMSVLAINNQLSLKNETITKMATEAATRSEYNYVVILNLEAYRALNSK